MNRKTIVVAAAAGALVVSAGTAFALATNDSPTTPAAVRLQPTSSTSTSTSDSPTSSSSSDTPTPSAPSSSTSTGTTAPGEPRLSADDATLIVQERLGGGQVHEVERELEHGRLEWKVEISKDGVTYDIRVDAQTGDITRVETDDDDRGRDDDGRDDHDDDYDDDDRGGDDNSGPGGGDDDGDDDSSGHGRGGDR